MVKKNKMWKYTGVSIPKDLANAIDDHIECVKELSYSTRAEFIKEAIREKIAREKLSNDELLEKIKVYERIIKESEEKEKKFEEMQKIFQS